MQFGTSESGTRRRTYLLNDTFLAAYEQRRVGENPLACIRENGGGRAGDACGPTNAPHTTRPPFKLRTFQFVAKTPDCQCGQASRSVCPTRRCRCCVHGSPQARMWPNRRTRPEWGVGWDRTNTIATRRPRQAVTPMFQNVCARSRSQWSRENPRQSRHDAISSANWDRRFTLRSPQANLRRWTAMESPGHVRHQTGPYGLDDPKGHGGVFQERAGGGHCDQKGAEWPTARAWRATRAPARLRAAAPYRA
jgi:hypothetical protein